MEEILRGIVLGGVSYGDNDKILSIYTIEKGTVSAKIKGVKKAGAKLKFASEPFCFAEFVFSVSGDRRTVIGATLIESFYPLRTDLKTFYLASACLEFVKKFAKENIVSKNLFTVLIDALKSLSYGEQSERLKVTLEFFIQGLFLVGYALNLGDCAFCAEKLETRVFFDYQTGAFYHENCKPESAREIRFSTYKALRDLYKLEQSESDLINALKLINYYIERKTDENLKSLKELAEIF